MKGLRKHGHKFLIMGGLFVILLIIYMSMRKIEGFKAKVTAPTKPATTKPATTKPATTKPAVPLPKTRECMTYCDNQCASQSDTTPPLDFDFDSNPHPVASPREQCTSTCYETPCKITQLQWDKIYKRYNPV
jgi:hypothetical protein